MYKQHKNPTLKTLTLAVVLLTSQITWAENSGATKPNAQQIKQLTSQLATLEKQKNYTESYALARKRYELEPNKKHAESLARFFNALPREEQANNLKSHLSFLVDATEKYKNSDSLTSSACWTTLVSHNMPLAESYCLQAFELEYDSPATIINLGHVEAHKGNIKKAKRLYNHSLAMAALNNATWFLKSAKQDFADLSSIYAQGTATEVKAYIEHQWQSTWKALLDISKKRVNAYNAKDWQKALELAQQQKQQIAQTLGTDNLVYAEANENTAFYHQKLNDTKQAIADYQTALTIKQTHLGKNNLSVAKDLNYLAGLYRQLGNYDQALPLYQKALKIKEDVLGENHLSTATSYDNLASLYKTIGNYDKALPLYQKALKVREKALGENHESTSISYNNLAVLYKTLGNYDKALPLYQKALKITKELLGENHESTAISYNNLADLYETLGNYNKALLLHQKALKIKENVLGENHESTATSYNNLANLYETLRDWNKALPLYQKALKITEEVLGKNHTNTAISYNNLAVLYKTLGNYDQALPLYQKSLKIREKVLGENHTHTAISYNNLAGLYETLGNYDKALPLYQKALKINEKVLGKHHLATILSYNNLSFLSRMTNQPLPAYYYASLAHRGYLHNRNTLFSILDSQGREAFVKKNHDYTPLLLKRARKLIEVQHIRPVEVPDWLKGAFGTEDNKQTSTTKLRQPTPEELKYTPELKPVSNDVIKSDTLSAWLNTKGALYDSENALAMLKHSTTDKAVLALIDELTAAKLLLASLYKQQQDDKVIDRIKQTQSKIAELESQLASRSERYRAELGLKNISTKDMSASLSDNQVYIDFAYTDDGYYVFGLDKQGNISFHHLDKSVSQRIDGLVKAFQSSISEYNTKLSERNGAIDRDEVIALGKAHKQQLSELYQLLFSNHPELLSKPELVISADGALRLLPFDALTDHAGNYLIESKTIRYIPSGKEWLRLSRQANKQEPNKNQANATDLTILYNPSYQTNTVKDKSVITTRAATPNTDLSQVKLIDLAFDNLAGTEKEGEAIVRLAKANHKTKIQDYSETQANKDNLLNTTNSDYLHIASHGFFINDKSIQNPMLKSGLALAGAKKGSYTGKVTALELMGMQLAGTDTVVLSACETGKVDITDTQGVSGLTKAFIQAGANNVIMSLWSVPDTATANLMQDYYKNTYNNQTKNNKAQALRQAKLSFIKQNKQPIDWAGFVISGGG